MLKLLKFIEQTIWLWHSIYVCNWFRAVLFILFYFISSSWVLCEARFFADIHDRLVCCCCRRRRWLCCRQRRKRFFTRAFQPWDKHKKQNLNNKKKSINKHKIPNALTINRIQFSMILVQLKQNATYHIRLTKKTYIYPNENERNRTEQKEQNNNENLKHSTLTQYNILLDLIAI